MRNGRQEQKIVYQGVSSCNFLKHQNLENNVTQLQKFALTHKFFKENFIKI